jgi:hypothetical protein
MKFTSIVALSFAAVKADVSSLQEFLPRDGADFISTCDQNDGTTDVPDFSGDIDQDEFLDCMNANASTKEQRRIARTVSREWSSISNASSVIGEDEAKALYWSFICSDSEDDD